MRWDDYSDNFHDLDGDGRVSFEEEIIGDCLLADHLRHLEDDYDDEDDEL